MSGIPSSSSHAIYRRASPIEVPCENEPETALRRLREVFGRDRDSRETARMMDIERIVAFLQSYPTWTKIVAIACQTLFVGVLVLSPRKASGEFAFWARAKTGIGRHLTRHSFRDLEECRKAEEAFQPKRFLLTGCGCNDKQPTKDELINQYLLGDEVAGEMARVLGFNVPTGPEDTGTRGYQTKGDWRFWFAKDGRLLDEMFGSREECLKYQRHWDHARNGPIVFPCAEVNEDLLILAAEKRSTSVELAAEWHTMIERALEHK